jgi:PTH1 family peptidyl-tRNA hydrolase
VDPADWLVVGLGNPGPEYADTRHNVGFAVVERLAARHGGRFGTDRSPASWARVRISGASVALLKPLAFMNASGPPVAGWRGRLALPPAQVILVHDDLDLPVGRIRIVRRAGDGGHRGVASVQEALGTDDLPRVRVGIGRPAGTEAVVERVLSRFEAGETDAMAEALDRAADAVEAIIGQGPSAAMNRFNVREKRAELPTPSEASGGPSRADVGNGK